MSAQTRNEILFHAVCLIFLHCAEIFSIPHNNTVFPPEDVCVSEPGMQILRAVFVPT